MKKREWQGSPFFVQSSREVTENWLMETDAFEAAKRACKDKRYAKELFFKKFEHTSLIGARKGGMYYLLTPPEAYELVSGEIEESDWEFLWEVHWPSGWAVEWSTETEKDLRLTYRGSPKSMR